MSATLSLAGKRAFVTGAGQGIGRAAAEAFIEAGARVVAADNNAANLATLSGCTKLQCDVTDPAQIDELGKLAPFDVVFNCAGIVHNGTILDCSQDDWDTALAVNVTSMFRIIRTLLPGMIGLGGGSIINMASVASSIIGVPSRLAYGASKAAVIGLTKAVAADHAHQLVRCNAICPGTVESPSLLERVAATGDFAAGLKRFKARQPMGRLGQPSEIATLALYLASDASAFTTGQCHVIDGGWSNI